MIRPNAAEIAPQGHFPALRAQGATAPAEPRNDKLGSAFFPCHCEEGASPTWQSQAGSDESAGGFPVFRPVLRDCRALLRKARNDKSGSIAPLNSCHQYCQPAWRSLSAATDAIGAYHFIGSHYESAASRRARLSAPLQHYIALQKGRTCSPALSLSKKVPLGFFAKSCLQNCKIKFCSMIFTLLPLRRVIERENPDGFLVL